MEDHSEGSDCSGSASRIGEEFRVGLGGLNRSIEAAVASARGINALSAASGGGWVMEDNSEGLD